MFSNEQMEFVVAYLKLRSHLLNMHHIPVTYLPEPVRHYIDLSAMIIKHAEDFKVLTYVL